MITSALRPRRSSTTATIWAAGNTFCDLFERAPPGGAPSGEQEFRIIEGSLIQGPVNFAKLVAKGIDVEARLSRQHRQHRQARHAVHLHPRARPIELPRPDRSGPSGRDRRQEGRRAGRSGGCVQLEHLVAARPIHLRLPDALPGQMYLNTYEDFNAVQGRDPENADYADRKKYPSVFYHDIRFGVDIGPKYNFYLGVDNLTNTSRRWARPASAGSARSTTIAAASCTQASSPSSNRRTYRQT